MTESYFLNQGYNPHWICICGIKNSTVRKRCVGCNMVRGYSK